MKPCSRPIDALDAEALSAGSEPVIARDAAEHVRQCPSCAKAVENASRLNESLSAGGEADFPADLASRVLRLRAFSRRELRTFALWRAACGLCVAVFFAGVLLLTLPGITLREQAGLGVAVVGPLTMLLRAFLRAVAQTWAAAPSGLQALSQTLRQQQTLGLTALGLLFPILYGLRRAVARSRR